MEWHKDWSSKYRQRLAISLPMTTRIDQRLLAAVLTAWAESAHATVVTKKAVKRAMTPVVASTGAGAAVGVGAGGGGGRSSSAVFYSKSLNKLANFHKVKHRLEARNDKVTKINNMFNLRQKSSLPPPSPTTPPLRFRTLPQQLSAGARRKDGQERRRSFGRI